MLNYLPANDKKYDRNENGLYDKNEKTLTDRINVLRSQTLPETFKAIRDEKYQPNEQNFYQRNNLADL